MSDELRAEIAILRGEVKEARRRRDKWRKKAEGFDEIRLALREKVGAPWPPNMSRVLWAGLAADEKKRADDATYENARLQAQIETAKDALQRIDDASNHYAMTPTYSEGVLRYAHKSTRNLARAALKELENTDDRA